ncbi:MAG TPA: hypothetical protein VHD56_01125 [Tepidisphaeraceae bacterium]|nr:hypothetical protein [Tepidisphaeraceae bacterium]
MSFFRRVFQQKSRMWRIFCAVSAAMCIVTIIQKIQDIQLTDSRDRLFSEFPLPFKMQLSGEFGVRLESRGNWNNTDTSRGLEETDLYKLGYWRLEQLGFTFQMSHWVNISSSGQRTRGPIAFWSIGFPYWFVITLTSVAPAIFLILREKEWWRKRRLKKGLCEHCGYDLRASTGRCPECGTEIPKIESAQKPASS